MYLKFLKTKMNELSGACIEIRYSNNNILIKLHVSRIL